MGTPFRSGRSQNGPPVSTSGICSSPETYSLASIDNVDYNAIKRLIKARTTNGEARAISIPGKENDGKALKELETELYAELFDQHQRIDLFVQSKSGEIKRRLSSLSTLDSPRATR